MWKAEKFQLIPETETEGFIYAAVTPPGENAESGTGFVLGPDGTRAGIKWLVVEDDPYIVRLFEEEDPHWGVYELGFVHPVHTVEDLVLNLKELMPKMAEIYHMIR